MKALKGVYPKNAQTLSGHILGRPLEGHTESKVYSKAGEPHTNQSRRRDSLQVTQAMCPRLRWQAEAR